MVLSDSFMKMFDKAVSFVSKGEKKNIWTVEEHECDATMTQLEIKANGTFWGFDHQVG